MAFSCGVIFMSNECRAGGLVTPDEMLQKAQWVKVNLPKFAATEPTAAIIVERNLGQVIKDARGKSPLQIGKTQYKRGLFCHANSLLTVQLPSEGKSFSATVGLDHNDDTKGGTGSIVFCVKVGQKEAFKSYVMRYNTPAAVAAVDLGGAKSFTLEVAATGESIGWDQADWADAKVTLAGGKELYLSDLPVIQQPDASVLLSFTYNGQPSDKLLSTWGHKDEPKKLDDTRTQYTTTWTDPKTGLEVRLVAVEYSDFPVVEWTVWFKNTGSADTPLLADVQGLDLLLSAWKTTGQGQPPAEFILRSIRGDDCSASSYEPIQLNLGAGANQTFAPVGGRPTNGSSPWFNLDWGGQGAIVVLGWPGQWSARFQREGTSALHVRGGQELTSLKLHPGEEIRTPLSVLMFWKGDAVHAQNLWRRWMIAHNVPRPGGKLPGVFLAACQGLQQSEKSETEGIELFDRNKVGLTHWWMDAGWYPCNGAWWKTGTWEPDPARFPKGIRPVSDLAHSKGMKLVLWFEPERARPGSWLAENHAQWLLGRKNDNMLLNLGNPEARQWLTDHIDKLITDQGIDLYRQDHNFDPLAYWRAADAADRQGITENLHVQGYLAYWDELRRRHPDMLIDSCASGGRRNDLETLRRAIPLLRSDFQEPQQPGRTDMLSGNQGHTYGLTQWVPYYGTGEFVNDSYAWRSHLCPSMGIGWDGTKGEADWGLLRKRADEYRKIANLFWGDFYPLTGYSKGEDVWMAWQFNRPEKGDGMVQAFRRKECVFLAADMKLCGLKPNARYRITDMDTGKTQEATGEHLMSKGLRIDIDDCPGAVIKVYQELP